MVKRINDTQLTVHNAKYIFDWKKINVKKRAKKRLKTWCCQIRYRFKVYNNIGA